MSCSHTHTHTQTSKRADHVYALVEKHNTHFSLSPPLSLSHTHTHTHSLTHTHTHTHTNTQKRGEGVGVGVPLQKGKLDSDTQNIITAKISQQQEQKLVWNACTVHFRQARERGMTCGRSVFPRCSTVADRRVATTLQSAQSKQWSQLGTCRLCALNCLRISHRLSHTRGFSHW